MRTANAYRYRAATRDGAIANGTVRADSRDAARATLATRGLYPIGLHEVGPRNRVARLSTMDLALGLRMLADLFEADLPVSQVLVTFRDLAPDTWRSALPAIEQSVREGESLAAALDACHLGIPPLVVGMLHAGEAGGGIGRAMRRAAQWSEKTAEARAALYSALAYPAFVATAGAGAILVLVTVVLPRFARVLAELDESLPTSTRVLLAVSNEARHLFAPAGVAVVVTIIGFRAWLRSEANRRRFHAFLLRVPMLGNLRRSAATARVAHSLATMLSTGVRLSASLPFAGRACGDLEIEARIADARELVVAGMTLSRAIELKRAGTVTAVRLIKAGEESGRLVEMLEHAGRIEETRVDRALRTATRLLEPALLLGFALIVGFTASALLQAIYSVRPG